MFSCLIGDFLMRQAIKCKILWTFGVDDIKRIVEAQLCYYWMTTNIIFAKRKIRSVYHDQHKNLQAIIFLIFRVIIENIKKQKHFYGL